MSEDNFDDEFSDSLPSGPRHPMAYRFHGYLPIVVDIGTGGFNSTTDVLLKVTTTAVGMDEKSFLFPKRIYLLRIEPFEDVNIESAALEFTDTKPDHPLCMAVQEEAALTEIFRSIRKALKANGHKWAILVGYNSSFDLGFLNVVMAHIGAKRNLLHSFSSLDTVTLVGLAYDQTVLAKACQVAGMGFDNREVHLACHDAERTTELFCGIVNRWKEMGGWMDDDD